MRKTVAGSTDRQFGNLDRNHHHQTVMITAVATSQEKVGEFHFGSGKIYIYERSQRKANFTRYEVVCVVPCDEKWWHIPFPWQWKSKVVCKCRGTLLSLSSFFIVFKHFKFFLLQHVCLHDLARVDDVMVTYLRAKNLSFMCVKSRPRKRSRKSSSEICTNNKNKSALHLTVLKTILPDCFVLMDMSQVVYMECNRKEVKLYQSGKISFTYGCKNWIPESFWSKDSFTKSVCVNL